MLILMLVYCGLNYDYKVQILIYGRWNPLTSSRRYDAKLHVPAAASYYSGKPLVSIHLY